MAMKVIHKQQLTTLLGIKCVVSSCFKQLPPSRNISLELFIHTSFGEKCLFAV